ncbi:MAG: signal peptidase I [Candidatus Rokuibacteriota bacterium]
MDERKVEVRPKAGIPLSGSADGTGGAAESAGVKVRRKSLVREYGEAIVIAIALALIIRTLVVQAFTIPSGSMMDTLLVGDYILVNKFLYGPELPFTELRMPGLRAPQRGDIIVFKYPQDEKRDFIKRIVAVPGDQILIRGHDVHVNGQRLPEAYVKHTAPPHSQAGQPYCGYAYGCEATTVPPGSYFVMGDNRDNSQDSRYWGFVRGEKIKGKAFLIYWSWDSDRTWLRWWRLGKYIP